MRGPRRAVVFLAAFLLEPEKYQLLKARDHAGASF